MRRLLTWWRQRRCWHPGTLGVSPDYVECGRCGKRFSNQEALEQFGLERP